MAEPRRLRGEVADAPEREPTLRRRVHHRRRPEKKSSGGYGTRADHSVGFSQVLKLGHGQRASPLLADFGMNVPSWVPGEPKRSKAHRPALPLRARRSFPTTSSPFAFRRGSFFGKAAGAGAGWGNSLTPSRGARQEEEEPPVPLPPSSDFAGEEEEKEGFCRVWLGEGEQDRGGQRRGRILGRSWGWKGRGGGGGGVWWLNRFSAANVGMAKSKYSTQTPWVWGKLGWLFWSPPHFLTLRQQVWGPLPDFIGAGQRGGPQESPGPVSSPGHAAPCCF